MQLFDLTLRKYFLQMSLKRFLYLKIYWLRLHSIHTFIHIHTRQTIYKVEMKSLSTTIPMPVSCNNEVRASCRNQSTATQEEHTIDFQHIHWWPYIARPTSNQLSIHKHIFLQLKLWDKLLCCNVCYSHWQRSCAAYVFLGPSHNTVI